RSHAPLDCRGIDERFEARTGLSIRLCGVVEFVGVEIVTTNHRDDLAGLRVERHHRTLHGRNLRELDFEMPVLFINFLDLELSQLTVLELAAWLPFTPTHIGGGQRRGEVAE